jgi:uncharacterized membrane protein (UPF0182 family)
MSKIEQIPGMRQSMKRRSILMIALVAIFLVVVTGLPALIRLIVDWYWFSEIEYQAIFLTELWTKVALGTIAGVISFAFFYANLRFAQRGMVPDPMVISLSPEAPKVDVTRAVRKLILPVSLVLGLLVGLSAPLGWMEVQQFLHRTSFGIADPVFNRDVGYYFFSLPAIDLVISSLRSLVFMALFMTVPLYLLRRDIVFLKRRVSIERSAEVHLGVLVIMMFVATALSIIFVRIPSVLYSTNGQLVGANYTDLHVRIPVLNVAWVVALLAALFVLFGVLRKRAVLHTAIAVAVYFLVAGVFGAILPAAVQKFVVAPTELAKEEPQIRNHIEATRAAWGLDDVVTRDLSGEAHLELEDIQANRGTIDNVRLWDRGPLLQTFGQLQEIRTYYDFVSVDDDRYWINGQYRQVLLSPRELNTASLPTRNFINERLTFTHGMGLTLGPVNQVSQEGLPVLFVQDLPPSSNVSLQVTRPQIYYGELSNDYVFVNTRQREFDYPLGDSSAFTEYAGTGGVRVSSLLRKLLFSLRFQSLDILLSEYITTESRILYYRNIRDRVTRALSFLSWDDDPYLVITEDGHLKWIFDAFTKGYRYPYSRQVADGANYVRNSVKVVLDAYDGNMRAYVSDPTDPVIQTYAKIFQGVFLPLEEMSQNLRAHIRYPQDLFELQTDLYTTYHMDEPDVFYHREDQWQIPVVSSREGTRDPFLRHIVMKLPGESQEEFIFMTPFTPRGKDNLAAWMVARNDGDAYGQLVVYKFPRQSLVFGPTQIVNRMNQDTEISRQISLWDQRGSEVIRGNLLVIPIEESLIFVQAIYLRAEGGRIPELKRVVVAYQNRVVMEETLGEGLARLFGGEVGTDSPRLGGAIPAESVTGDMDADVSVADLVNQLSEHYENAVAAQRTGDWATYGEELRRIGELVRRLRERTGG